MSEMLNAISGQLDFDALAQQLGTDAQTAQEAVEVAVPTLAQGLSAETASEDRIRSLATALEQDHGADLIDSDDPLAQVDANEGEAILGHVFGDQKADVTQQLGGLTGKGGGMFSKLLPMLAPLAMSWLTKSMGSPQKGATDGGILGDLGGLGGLLGGEAESGRSSTPDLGGLFDMLGGGAAPSEGEGSVDADTVPDVGDILGGDKQ